MNVIKHNTRNQRYSDIARHC